MYLHPHLVSLARPFTKLLHLRGSGNCPINLVLLLQNLEEVLNMYSLWGGWGYCWVEFFVHESGK